MGLKGALYIHSLTFITVIIIQANDQSKRRILFPVEG